MKKEQKMVFHNQTDTISAIATPLGSAGVGVVRLSGDGAFDIISKNIFQ